MTAVKERSKLSSLGDYELIEEIGRGALGTVFLGQQRYLKTKCAVKVLPEGLQTDDGFLERLQKEATAFASINDPHLLKMHSASFLEGKYFIVSDYLENSCSLLEYLQKKSEWTEQELIQFVTEISSALEKMHRAKKAFSHGNLKLTNVLVQTRDGETHFFLNDAGLSRAVGVKTMLVQTFRTLAENAEIPLLSKWAPLAGHQGELTRSFLQNYYFLSPEQRKGEDKFDPVKADIWSFGVLVYFLIFRFFPEGLFPLPAQEFSQFSLNWDHFLSSCLQLDPKKRASSIQSAVDDLLRSKANQVESSSKGKPILKPQEIARPQYDPDPAAQLQVDTAIVRYQPKKQESDQIEPLLTEMTVIPATTALRGSNNGGRDEMPRHSVNLTTFALDVHPVTNEQFTLFLEAMGGEKDSNNSDLIRLRDSRIKRNAGKLIIESGYGKHPVVGVSWYGAMAYAKWVGKRLPTEAEWEVAAYGGLESNLYPTGEDIERSQANFFSSDTTSVMSYPPNEYGLFDMAGNVYEWCQDWYDYHYYSSSAQEPNNPKGPAQGVYRVLRGGCWKSLKEDLRCAHRHRNNPGIMNGTYGFRCATDVS